MHESWGLTAKDHRPTPGLASVQSDRKVEGLQHPFPRVSSLAVVTSLGLRASSHVSALSTHSAEPAVQRQGEHWCKSNFNFFARRIAVSGLLHQFQQACRLDRR